MRIAPAICFCLAAVTGALAQQGAAPMQPATMPAELRMMPGVTPVQESKPQFWFGVGVQNVPPWMARQLKLEADQGLLVMMIVPDSPAAKAGLKPDDLLIAIGDEESQSALKSQEQLARAANNILPQTVSDDKKIALKAQASTLVFLRDGAPQTARITPILRPGNAQVVGANLDSFTPANGKTVVMEKGDVRLLLSPNGNSVWVGPGYSLDLNSGGADVKMVREATNNSQTIVYIQETDDTGVVRATLRRGREVYVLEDGKLDNVPRELKPLAQQMLGNKSQMQANANRGSEALQLQIRDIQKENEELRKQMKRDRQAFDDKLDELTKLVKQLLPKGQDNQKTENPDKSR